MSRQSPRRLIALFLTLALAALAFLALLDRAQSAAISAGKESSLEEPVSDYEATSLGLEKRNGVDVEKNEPVLGVDEAAATAQEAPRLDLVERMIPRAVKKTTTKKPLGVAKKTTTKKKRTTTKKKKTTTKKRTTTKKVSSGAKTHTVKLSSSPYLMYYDPKNLTLNAGDTVSWFFPGGLIFPHSVVEYNPGKCNKTSTPRFNSGWIQKSTDSYWSYTFGSQYKGQHIP